MHTRPNAERPDPSDGDLVREARGGRQEAFEGLVRRYQGLAIARAYAVVKDRDEAQDVAQEAFMQAFRSLGQLREPDAFGPWLLRAVRNVALRAAKKRGRRPAELREADGARDPGPRAEVLDAIAALPEGDQQVIHLFYSQGHTVAEIARLLGLQVGSVTSRLTRARQRLRQMLREE